MHASDGRCFFAGGCTAAITMESLMRHSRALGLCCCLQRCPVLIQRWVRRGCDIRAFGASYEGLVCGPTNHAQCLYGGRCIAAAMGVCLMWGLGAARLPRVLCIAYTKVRELLLREQDLHVPCQ